MNIPPHHLSNESFLQPTKRRAQPQPSVKQEQSQVRQWRWRTVPRNADVQQFVSYISGWWHLYLSHNVIVIVIMLPSLSQKSCD